MNGITGVILNWKRPTNVARILSSWKTGGIVDEAIVWNNNKDVTFRDDWASVVNTNEDMGLYTRFAAASLARNDCVLIQDDDLEVPVESLQVLFDAWRADPEIVHGVFGRAPKSDGSYARNIGGNADSPIVLTRILLAHRRYASRFFQVAPTFDELQREGRPAGNGEDIVFSYVARHASGRLNRVHLVPLTELPAPHSIHGRNWKAHVKHRTRLLKACEQWLNDATDDFVTQFLTRSDVQGEIVVPGNDGQRRQYCRTPGSVSVGVLS